MYFARQQVEPLLDYDGNEILNIIEDAGRTCYKSHHKNPELDPGIRDRFIENAISRGHKSIIEHCQLSFRVLTNRGILAEWTRHRIASYSVESSRYCKYGTGLQLIVPWYLDETGLPLQEDYYEPSVEQKKINCWLQSMKVLNHNYLEMLALGCTPQEARGSLPLDTAVEMVATMNLRSLRNFFELRCGNAAHPQIRQLAQTMLTYCAALLPPVFGDLV